MEKEISEIINNNIVLIKENNTFYPLREGEKLICIYGQPIPKFVKSGNTNIKGEKEMKVEYEQPPCSSKCPNFKIMTKVEGEGEEKKESIYLQITCGTGVIYRAIYNVSGIKIFENEKSQTEVKTLSINR